MCDKNVSYVYTYKAGSKVVYVGIGTGPSFGRALDIKGHKRVYAAYGKNLDIEVVATGLSREVAFKVEGAIGLALGDSVMNSSKVLVRPAPITATLRISGPKEFKDFYNGTAGQMATMRRDKDAEGVRKLNRGYLKLLYSMWLKSRRLDSEDPKIRRAEMAAFLERSYFKLAREPGTFGKVLTLNPLVWKSIGGLAGNLPIPMDVKEELARLKRRVTDISDKTKKRRVRELIELSKEYPVLSGNIWKWIRKHDLGRLLPPENSRA